MNLVALISALFGLGLYAVLSRRDIIGVLAGVEIMLGSATLALIGLGTQVQPAIGQEWATGTLGATGLIVLVVAAAEAAVGLALLVEVTRVLRTSRIDEMTEVRG